MNTHFAEQQARERINGMMREASADRFARSGSAPSTRVWINVSGATKAAAGWVHFVVKSVQLAARGQWGKAGHRSR